MIASQIMSNADREFLDQTLTALKRKTDPDLPDDIFFERLVTRQILKSRDLGIDELMTGFVGGGTVKERDGGVDSIYFFCDGHLVTDEMQTKDYSRPGVSLQLYLIQAKRSDGFEEVPITKFLNVTNDLLDLTQDVDTHSTTYSSELRAIIGRFRKWRYAFVADAQMPDVTISFHYVTKGDQVHTEVQKKATQLENRVRELIQCQCKLSFTNASGLLALLRATKTTTGILKYETDLDSDVLGDAYICLSALKDFVDFIKVPETHERKEYLLAPNVRNYLGQVAVNKQIADTLKGKHDAEFWWLNNGVTVVGTKVIRKTSHYEIESPRIVNGLQTSRELYNFARDNNFNLSDDQRHVMVRILESKEDSLTNRILKSTNSQTRINAIYLFSTDEIHFKLESSFPGIGLFYERVINQWVDQEKPSGKIVTFPFLMTALIAMYSLAPNEARGRPNTFGTKEYKKLFDPKRRPSFYSNAALLMKRVDQFLENKGLDRRKRQNYRYYLAMWACCSLCKKAKPYPKDLADMNLDEATDDFLESCYIEVDREFENLIQPKVGQEEGADPDKVAKAADLTAQLKQLLSEKYPLKK